ncbi:hypothetical protein JKF63_03519 [Porcisia hertigi]|uniref:Uncharacterized protein n=1 Tax=Porcisia hertigi TaxID=2761500 RepID=A0A836ILH3_9TRYP|nr:hypothetical protein JKF63_03519 [Porcisia hertigi]
MLWTHQTLLAVAGAGAVLSVGHYLAKVRSITGRVPVHFNLFGVPDSTAAPWAFVMYPIVALGLATAMMYTVLAPNARAVLVQNTAEQVSTRASLLYGQVVGLACQYYAARIAEGSSERMSSSMMCMLYGTLVAVSSVMLATKSTRHSV